MLGILFAISGTSIASTSNHEPTAGISAPNGKTLKNPCSNTIILSTGGLCCPLSPSPGEKCSQRKPRPINRAASTARPLAVNGVIIPLPIAAQMVKKGLRRSWSPAKKDRNLIVCGYGRTEIEHSSLSNSRIPELHCLSNEAHFRHSLRNPYSEHLSYDPRKTNIHCYANCFLTQGNVAASLGRYVDHSSHRAQLISSLISRMPTSKAAHSLRVPETVPIPFPSMHNKIVHAPVFVTFTIKNGDLSDIELSKRNKNTEITTN